MYLGIDLGTASVKLMLIDRRGREEVVSRPYVVKTPESGSAETDPGDWISAIRDAAGHLPPLKTLRAIGLSGQMHGIVPLGNGGINPVHNAILWADRRSSSCLNEFEGLDRNTRRRMQNPPAAGMAGATLIWLKRERPRIFQDIRTVLFPKDFIRAALTGGIATDYSDASGSLLYDFDSRGWYRDLMVNLDLKEEIFPQIRPSVEVGGTVSPEGARRLGLPEGVPVAVGAGDAPAGMFGSGIIDPSWVQISIGTAAQISRPIPAGSLPDPTPSLNLFEGVEPGRRYRVAAMLNAGIALEWVRGIFRREWGEIYGMLERRGIGRPLDSVFLPYLSGERTPYMNPEARGSWLGLSLHHDETDLLFASLLGVACSIRLGMDTLGSDTISRVRAVGGSLRYPFWRKLVAATIRHDLIVSAQKDISARGAAFIAAASIGDALPPRDAETETQPAESVPWIEEYYREFKDAYRRINFNTDPNPT